MKTLHPKVHGGILAQRDVPAHIEALGKLEIPTIDIVVVNLYPFAQTIASPNCPLAAIENIDIGGPTMVRAAAKNYQHVTIVTDPADYAELPELQAAGGVTSLATRFGSHAKLSRIQRPTTATISNYLTGLDMQGHRIAFLSSSIEHDKSRICVTERTRIRRRLSTAISNLPMEHREVRSTTRQRTSYNNIEATPMPPGVRQEL